MNTQIRIFIAWGDESHQEGNSEGTTKSTKQPNTNCVTPKLRTPPQKSYTHPHRHSLGISRCSCQSLSCMQTIFACFIAFRSDPYIYILYIYGSGSHTPVHHRAFIWREQAMSQWLQLRSAQHLLSRALRAVTTILRWGTTSEYH